MKFHMENSIFNFKEANPFVLLLASLAYCYYLVSKFPKGFQRLFLLLPIFYTFSLLPWFSPSSLLRGFLSFFLTWIASFKLLLFAFNKGPISDSKSFIDFILITVLPLRVSDSKSDYPRYEIMPLFNKPYLATSLQEFWGKRWNRYSSNILRMTVYDPIRESLTGMAPLDRVVALMMTLLVSGAMHEVMFYYITCGKKPSWEVTWFFVLQGVSMVGEVGLKKLVARATGWTAVRSIVSRSLTCGFVIGTFYWLLVMPVMREGRNDCGF